MTHDNDITVEELKEFISSVKSLTGTLEQFLPKEDYSRLKEVFDKFERAFSHPDIKNDLNIKIELNYRIIVHRYLSDEKERKALVQNPELSDILNNILVPLEMKILSDDVLRGNTRGRAESTETVEFMTPAAARNPNPSIIDADQENPMSAAAAASYVDQTQETPKTRVSHHHRRESTQTTGNAAPKTTFVPVTITPTPKQAFSIATSTLSGATVLPHSQQQRSSAVSLSELAQQTVTLQGPMMAKEEYRVNTQKALAAIESKISDPENFPDYVGVKLEKLQDGFKLEIPRSSGKEKKDHLIRNYDLQTQKPKITLTNPPDDNSIFLLMETNQDIRPLIMTKSCQEATTALRLFEASVISNIPFNLHNDDEQLLKDNPQFIYLKQIVTFPEARKEFIDSIRQNTNRKLGEPIDQALIDKRLPKKPNSSLDFTGP